MAIITMRGEMWPRNDQTVGAVPGSADGGQGLYILYDGSMPVYVGKGNLRRRIRNARNSKRRGQSWDHFSWYVVPDAADRHEAEALLLRMLPPQLRILNRQRGKLVAAKKVPAPKDHLLAEPIKRPL